ncbi:MAG: hypothetical protein ISR98_00355 [Parcubacteria group bacterium]|nr:hypothetical protein [Parcubacteria group bacterium]
MDNDTNSGTCTIEEEKSIEGFVFVTATKGCSFQLSSKNNELPPNICTCAKKLMEDKSNSLYVTVKSDDTPEGEFLVELWKDQPENCEESLIKLYGQTTIEFARALERFGINSSDKFLKDIGKVVCITLVLKS